MQLTTRVAARRSRGAVELGSLHIVRGAVAFAIVALGAVLVVLEARVLMVLLAGVLFALALRGMTTAVTARVRVPDSAALGALALGLIAILGLGSYALGAAFAHQAEDLARRLSEAWNSLLGAFHNRPALAPLVDRLQRGAVPGPEHGELLAGASGIVEAFGAGVIVLFIGIYGAAQPEAYPRVALLLVPRRHRSRARATLYRTGAELTRWLAGRAVAMAVVGVLVTAGLLLLRVPLAWALGALAGLLTFVEYMGAFVSAAPGGDVGRAYA